MSSSLELECPSCNTDDPANLLHGPIMCEDPWHVEALAEAAIPQPEFPYLAYGVSLSLFGEEGGMIAPGRVEPRRFTAACNWLARKELGLCNIFDDRLADLEVVLSVISYRWAVLVKPTGDYEWQISWADITEATPGTMLFTVLDV